MRTVWSVGTVVVCLTCATFGATATVEPIKPKVDEVRPYGERLYTVQFKGGEEARVIVIGNGATYLGLYVYDPQGNCVARDDFASFPTRDDLAVGWVPRTTAPYTVEVKNLGHAINKYRIAIR